MARPDPSWWPVGEPVGLLDTRDELCRLSLVESSSGRVQSVVESALLRRSGSESGFSHWGRSARAWQGRLVEGEVQGAFPDGFPRDAAAGRWYLQRFLQAFPQGKRPLKLFLVESEPRPWARQLWSETLEELPLSVAGYLTPWQHDLYLAKGGDLLGARAPHLHLRLEPVGLSWHLLREGEVVGAGTDSLLAETRLLDLLGDQLRRQHALDVAPSNLREVWLRLAEAGRSDTELQVAGRQIHSGLPSRQRLTAGQLLEPRPSMSQAWNRVKERIFAQAGLSASDREGLDLPGWRVLPSGALANLFVEGAVVRWLEVAG